MRKVLLISLAAVIVAGGLALTAYGADDGPGGRPPGRHPRGDRPDANGPRRGPPRPDLTPEKRQQLEAAMKAFMPVLGRFYRQIAEIVGPEYAPRVIMGAVMRFVREHGPRRPEGEGRPPRGEGPPRHRRPPRGEGEGPPRHDRPPSAEGGGPQ